MKRILVILASLLLAESGHARSPDDVAAEWVRKVNGEVERDHRLPGRPVVVIKLDECVVAVEDFKVLSGLKHLRSLSLWETHLSDALIPHLKHLPLEELCLAGTDITDVGLKELVGLRTLKRLDLSGTQVSETGLNVLKDLPNLLQLSIFGLQRDSLLTDEGLRIIAGFSHLESLSISASKVTGKGIRELAKLRSLTSLVLDGSKLTDAEMNDIATISTLKALNLRAAPISDAGLQVLSALTNLEELCLLQVKTVTGVGMKHFSGLKRFQSLNMAESGLMDVGLKEIATLKHLTLLDIVATEVTDTGIRKLVEMPGLTKLYIGLTKVTPEGITALRKAMPNCEIRK